MNNSNPFKGIDNELFKNLSNMMGNLPMNNSPFGKFDFKKIRKYILFAVISVFLSGVAVGLLIGLMF
jgi:hypothetical protein